MNFDYYCHTLKEQWGNIDKLKVLAADLKTKKKQQINSSNNIEKDKLKKKIREIESEIRNIYIILSEKDPSLFFLYLKSVNGIDEDFRSYWIREERRKIQRVSNSVKIDDFNIIPDINDTFLSLLPDYSFAIQFEFTLAKPYISKDDEEFYILDNPLKKEKVFKVPMISPSTWKGHMRWAMRKKKGLIGPVTVDDEWIVALFGNQRDDEIGRRGRLQFFPTFFENIDLEVINPHNRETKAGRKGPIFFQCVPKGSKGRFTLMYVPFDLIGKEEDKMRAEASNDLRESVQAIKEMMLIWGFSAKRTSGYGIVNNAITNRHIMPVIKCRDISGLKAIKSFDDLEENTEKIVKVLERKT